ncbi:oxygen-dependent tRNA uridine(34) hydroxylase TrhO [Candidatus Profftia sp. (ex Adelges kitamiensis)]|uniref:oxygen-dependent tRNA uridine(34) hydroxylase TrhO n=1 Tax=Candidatus Profftia sp. (ex Adelges kitamiensis) TaxID=2864218 RepID=UPI001CE39526|nr:rhodanese-related sulfurtransferase [Candidatus Profftia sp. (ex Adelges kitamiensis)]
MPVLHNKISNQELKARLIAETEPRITISFYKYCLIKDHQIFRDILYINFFKLEVLGRIYIAQEGINAQISVPISRYKKMKKYLYQMHPDFNNLHMNIAVDNNAKSFWVLRIKVRNRILADGIDDPYFQPSNVGKYLKVREVNDSIEDPDTILVDMRNNYEYEVGHFINAITIPSDTFRDQILMVVKILKKNKNKKIIMYCTGGIRCEKASAYMLYNGFNNVYHIAGGIIEYTNYARKHGLPLKFIGKNFVFDARMGERITDDIISHCHQCGTSCDTHRNCFNNFCHVLFIQCLRCAEIYNKCCSIRCQRQIESMLDN